MENRTVKVWLFYFVLLILLLPFLQQCLGFIDSGPLLCSPSEDPNPTFTYVTWWAGSYQKQKTLYLNDSTGFRPDLVRLNNQLDFSLFGKLSVGDIIGRDGYVFGKEDVLEYNGEMYMGADQIRMEMTKVKRIQDTLQRLGKTFIFAYAPSKAHYVPEKIPGALKGGKEPEINNYKTFRTIGDSLLVNQLDYVALFRAMRDTSQNLLMTRQGFHWSIYGSLIATDTVIRRIEHERKIRMPHLVVTKMHCSDTARDSDNDLVKCTNLILPLSRERYSYPDFYYSRDSNAIKPRTLFLGDSFLWGWIAAGFMQNATTDWKYWTYFGDVWTENGSTDIRGYDWEKALAESDCVVILVTPMNLHVLTMKTRFLEQIYRHYYP